MTVSRPCYFGNLLLGVVGVDVNLAYILEDVTYYQDSLASYTFLIDNKGWFFSREITFVILELNRNALQSAELIPYDSTQKRSQKSRF